MSETIVAGAAATPTAADEAIKASADAKAIADAAAAKVTADNIAAAKPDFAAEEARIAALPEAERAAETAKLDEAKKAAQPVAADVKVVPEKYDLKLPEGSPLDAAFVERTAAIARELGLDQKGAETLLTTRTKEIADVQAALQPPDAKGENAGPLWVAREKEYYDQAFSDKAFGNGDQATFDANKEKAQQGLKILDGDNGPLRKLLVESAYGSHPVVLKALAILARKGSEGTDIRGAGGVAQAKKSDAQVMYPSMYNEDGSPKTN